jgi:Major Facilitator Superfamily
MTAARRNITESCRPGAQSIDVPGLLSFSFALALLVHVLISGTDSGWLHPPALAQLACAAMLLAAFVLFERRNAQAMIDIDLFRSKAFVGALLTMTGYGAAIQVLIFLLPLYLQTVYGFAPIIAGLAMVPFAFPMVIAPRFAAQLAGHMSMAGMLSVGLGFGVVGELAMAAAARTTLPYPWFAVGMVLVGCGAGLLNGLTVKAVQEAVPEERAGVASGMAATARFIGILVGVAGLGAVLSNHTSDLFLPATLLQGATPQVAETLSRHLVAGELAAFRAEMPAGITASIYEKGIHAYAGGFAAAMGLAALVAGVTALLAAWLLREPARQPVIQPCMPVDCRHPV